MEIIDYAWLIPIFPLIAFIIVGLFGNKLREGGGFIAIIGSLASMVLSILVAIPVLDGTYGVFEQSHSWIQLTSEYSFEVGIYIDTLTALMLLVVSIISTLVVIYSLGYMDHEGRRKRRYYAEISLFIGVMFGLVMANNFLELFIFWELVGLCSYLLIGFWYHKPSAASAAKKAFLVTRIGDIMFMVGLIILLTTFKTLNFSELFAVEASGEELGLLTLATLFIFGGAIGKSAQFPLHDWLPDAMEGPTTVSALIHAATMVKAGVYLVARSYPLFVQTPETLLVVAIVGGFTAIFAASMALNNPNIKRVLAYSTISQLGYMILALGAGGYMVYHGHAAEGYTAGMFHMMNHAFFKALLFLCAGSVIHAVGTEDMRLMGGLHRKMKLTSIAMLIGALSISGLPPFSGFWSKDEVLASVWHAGDVNAVFAILWLMGIITAFMTAFYMFRLWYMTFAGPEGEASGKAHESPGTMTGPLGILAMFATASGFTLFIGNGFAGRIFFGHPHELTALGWMEKIFTDPLTYLSIVLAVAGVLLAYAIYSRRAISSDLFVSTPGLRKIHRVLTERYGFTAGYDAFGEKVIYGFSRAVNFFDQRVIDGVVNGASYGIVEFGQRFRKSQTGMVQSYATVMIVGLTAILVILYLTGALG
ncbi:MAG: NADH-quinone oxidoreductase subunit L [Methanomassiliicoccales archaeon]